jgi:hypothetical protein
MIQNSGNTPQQSHDLKILEIKESWNNEWDELRFK